MTIQWQIETITNTLAEVKTDSGFREVKIPNNVIKILKKIRATSKSPFILSWEDGRPFVPSYLSHTFKDLLLKFNLPVIRFHDLRHTHATYLRDCGIDMETISERLGHANSAFTHAVYAHATADTQKQSASMIDRLF